MASIPRLRQITPASGTPGEHVQARLLGRGLGAVSAVWFSGAGVAARILGAPADDRLEISIAVAPDAAAGPRAVELSFGGQDSRRREAQGIMFHVLPRSSFGGLSGIGSHLI